MTELKQRILTAVQKPARYTGGEWGEVKKNLSDVRVRVAFCFPDTYEIGMSNLGMRILYGVVRASICPLGRHGSRNAEKSPSPVGAGKPESRPGFRYDRLYHRL